MVTMVDSVLEDSCSAQMSLGECRAVLEVPVSLPLGCGLRKWVGSATEEMHI